MHTLSAHARDYLSALKTVLESVGLDYLYHVNDFNKEMLCVFMGQFSSTKLRKDDDFLFLVLNAAFSNISAISWRPVLVVEEAGVPGENHRPWASNW